RQSAPVCYPLGGGRVVPRLKLSGAYTCQEHDGSCVTARIAIRVRVDADESQPTRFDAGLLQQLPAASVFHRLSNVYEASGEGIVALERLILALNKEHLAARVEYNAVDRQQRRFGGRHDGDLQGLVITPCSARCPWRGKAVSEVILPLP